MLIDNLDYHLPKYLVNENLVNELNYHQVNYTVTDDQKYYGCNVNNLNTQLFSNAKFIREVNNFTLREVYYNVCRNFKSKKSIQLFLECVLNKYNSAIMVSLDYGILSELNTDKTIPHLMIVDNIDYNQQSGKIFVNLINTEFSNPEAVPLMTVSLEKLFESMKSLENNGGFWCISII
jgi:hypothetical protein